MVPVNQPFSARAARRVRGALVSLAGAAELAAAGAGAGAGAAAGAAAPFVAPGPALPGEGTVAPASPAAVPGPWRPALSASAGEPVAAYAAPNAADIHP